MGGATRQIFRPTALSGSASRRYGSNTGGTSLQSRASPRFRAILIVGLLLNRLRLRRAHDRLRTSEEGMSLAAIAAKLRFWVWDIPRDEVRRPRATGVQETGTRRIPSILIVSSTSCIRTIAHRYARRSAGRSKATANTKRNIE